MSLAVTLALIGLYIILRFHTWRLSLGAILAVMHDPILVLGVFSITQTKFDLAVVAAILPMAFISGMSGPYMRPIPVGASAAMAFSLLVAFVVTPWAAVRLLEQALVHDRAAVGVEHVTVDPDGVFADPVQADDVAQAAADQPLNLDAAPVDLAGAVARLAGRGRTGQHAVLGRQPALALAG